MEVTKKITDWIIDDPVSLDKGMIEVGFTLHEKQFGILRSKLLAHHEEYLKKKLGLKFKIEFKGYTGLVQAIIPYKDKPIEFYKWWCESLDKIYLSYSEKLKLFITIYQQNPAVLSKEHRQLLNTNR